jgi:uncharacterized membrane protein YphA (DoxX/SURF4 family)
VREAGQNNLSGEAGLTGGFVTFAGLVHRMGRHMPAMSAGHAPFLMDNPNTALPSSLHSIQQTLRFTFVIVPIVAGLDKFTNLLVHWSDYLAPFVAGQLPVKPDSFMKIVGVIEIVAGLLVLARPRLGAVVVSAWLTLIALSLLASGRYLDVGVRDLVMAIGALTLARLSSLTENRVC